MLSLHYAFQFHIKTSCFHFVTLSSFIPDFMLSLRYAFQFHFKTSCFHFVTLSSFISRLHDFTSLRFPVSFQEFMLSLHYDFFKFQFKCNMPSVLICILTISTIFKQWHILLTCNHRRNLQMYIHNANNHAWTNTHTNSVLTVPHYTLDTYIREVALRKLVNKMPLTVNICLCFYLTLTSSTLVLVHPIVSESGSAPWSITSKAQI